MEKLVPLINKIQDIFATIGLSGIDLPQVAVIGSQSSGKSSVLESIVGKDFLPRGSGIVTRRPLILQLNYSASEEYAEFLHLPSQRFVDFRRVRDEIVTETNRLTGSNKGISPIPINLKIFSPRVINLTLVDLPGITKIAVGDQPLDIEDQIRNMVLEFIRKDSCLILAVSPANADIANSDALQLAKIVDPFGARTIGVLTKLDLMDDGTDCLDILMNKVYVLQHGFIGVVNRSQKEIDNEKDIESSLKKESNWFASHPVYSVLKTQCGAKYLQEKLSSTLISHIQNNINPLKDKIQRRMEQLEKELTALNSPFDLILPFHNDGFSLEKDTKAIAAHSHAIVLNIIRLFGSAVKSLIDGHDGDISGMFDSLQLDAANDYSDSTSGPRIIPELNSSVRIKYIFQELFPVTLMRIEARMLSSCFDDEIRTAIHNTRGLRAGLFVPDAVFEILVKNEIRTLEIPAIECVDAVHNELIKMINNLLNGKMSPVRVFPRLQKWMFEQISMILQESRKPTIDEVKQLISMETGFINTGHPDFLGKNGISRFIRTESEKKSINAAVEKENYPQAGQMEGFLTKLGGSRKNWKRRYFSLKSGTLAFFENPSDRTPLGIMSLYNCCVRDLSSQVVYPANEKLDDRECLEETNSSLFKNVNLSNTFEVFSDDGSILFRNHKYLFVQAETTESKNHWIHAITENIRWAIQERSRAEIQSNTSGDENASLTTNGNTVNRSKKIPPPRPPRPFSTNFHLQSVPDHLYSSNLSNSHNDSVSYIRVLLHSYFTIVRKHIQDLVPKAIMLLMVSKLKNDLVNQLSRRVLAEGSKIDALVEENDSVREERLAKSQLLKALKEALRILAKSV